MKFQIFDVSHGFCGLITCDNGKRLLIDCGHDNLNFSPGEYLSRIGCDELEGLIISNYDEDHVDGILEVRDRCRIISLFRNETVSPSTLRTIKSANHQISPAMRSTIAMSEEYTLPRSSPLDLGGASMYIFHNDYPTFRDTNNLSLVTFIEYGGTTIVYPGDLETDGWEALLEKPDFLSVLKRANIFIASHHGRTSGYNERVFDHCHPDIFIISDKSIIHETQTDSYAKHAKGVLFDGANTRRVLTTRNDGDISINLSDRRFFIQI